MAKKAYRPLRHEFALPIRSVFFWGLVGLIGMAPGRVLAEELPTVELPKTEGVSLHLQSTFIPQGYLPFHVGPDDPASGEGLSTETWTVTGYFGMRLWQSTEIYFNPEMYQGYLLRDFSPRNLAVAASVGNGEAQKGGTWTPEPYVARLYVSQTFGFGGEQEEIADDLNQIAGKKDISRLTLRFGKFSLPDFFDNNAYAHDTRSQFMNYALFDGGAFDFAGEVKGYTDGIVADFNQKDWAFRAAYVLMPIFPSSRSFDFDIPKRGSLVVELEDRYTLFSQPGKLRLLGFENTGNLGNYADAVALGIPPDIEETRKTRTKIGYVINLEQAITKDVGAFFRYSWNNAKTELCDFADIQESISGGFSIKGSNWGRPSDTVGIALALNEISPVYRTYLAAGGQGLLIGNGELPSYAGEKVIEAYYAYAATNNLTISADYQFIGNAAYFAERSPINMFTGRVHLQF